MAAVVGGDAGLFEGCSAVIVCVMPLFCTWIVYIVGFYVDEFGDETWRKGGEERDACRRD